MSVNFREYLAKVDNPKACEQSHVSQVWDDLEVTSQKAAHLLGQRTLHCIEPGLASVRIKPELFPHQSNGNGFVWCTYEQAPQIRAQLLTMIQETTR